VLYIQRKEMKDILQDIIAHTSALGFIELVKITGTDTETTINAIAEDKSVILSGTFKNPHPEFIGVVGMPNLGKLKTILSFDEYDEKAKINVVKGTRDDPNALSSIHFETVSGDFVNDYRFMAQSVIEEKVRSVTFHGSGWDIEIQPSVASILRLKKQQSANSEEAKFRTMVEDNNLKVYFGDPSSHSGNFVFESNITGKINDKFLWPVTQVLNILNLTGDKTLRLSNQGAMEITVDSGLCDYRYLLPAQQK
jgi:hypothetical protein